MPAFDATTLVPHPSAGTAFNAAGLTSLQGINPAQIAAKKAAEEAAKKAAEEAAKAGAAKFGLGTLMQGLGPAMTIYSILDAIGFFDKSLQETPMTPEERAKFEAESRLALASSGLAGGGEGAYETLMDAVSQASDTENVSQQEIADILGQSGYITSLTGAPGGTTEPTLVEMTQEKINKAASAVGKAQDTVFDIFGIPRPDYAVIQPNAPGGTVIWGEPSGGVFGRIGTTPGGTKVGVQTGIPALDILMGKVADVVSGRAAAGEILSPKTIEDIVVETAGAELGIPGSTASEVYTEAKNAAKKAGIFLDEETGRLGVDLGGGADAAGSDRVTTTGGQDAVDAVTGETATLGSDRVTTTGGQDAVDLVTGETATLGSDRVTTTGGGMRGVATEQAGVADIAMLYDPSLSLAENMKRILGKQKNAQADAVDSALMYGGGIVQPTDLNDEIRRIIEGR